MSKILKTIFSIAISCLFISGIAYSATYIMPNRGGTGVNSSNWTGYPYITNGSWGTSTPSGSADEDWFTDGTDMYASSTITQVGIATTTPYYTLDVNGTLRATTLYGDGSNLTGISAIAELYNATSSYFVATSTLQTQGIFIAEATSTLATTSATQLTVNEMCLGGTCEITWPSGGGDDNAIWSTSTNVIFQTTLSDSVGIGTNGPDRALDVLNATNPQLRLTHTDGSVYVEQRATSTGDLIITSNLGQLLATDSVGYNLSIGRDAGKILDPAAGIYNIYMGYRAGYLATSSDYNIGIGRQALYNTQGNYNVAMGWSALQNNTAGTQNFALGYQALTNNTSGDWGVAIGYSALIANTTGDYNIGIGRTALFKNTVGTQNVAIGGSALASNINGNFNVAIGTSALRYGVINGNYNTGIGTSAGLYASSSNNTFIGYSAGRGPSDYTGGNNIFIGYKAGYNGTSGTGNVLLGYDIDLPDTSTSNYLSIADVIYGDLSTNFIGIGTSTPSTTLDVYGQVAFSDGSYNSCTALETDANGLVVCGTDDNTTYTAGDYLTLTGTDFDLDAEVIKRSSSINLGEWDAVNAEVVQKDAETDLTITQIICYAKNTTTTITMDLRATSTPHTAGSKIFNPEMACPPYQSYSTTTFADATIEGGGLINLEIAGLSNRVASSTTVIIKYTIDD